MTLLFLIVPQTTPIKTVSTDFPKDLPLLYVDPSNITVSVGDVFEISVKIFNLTDNYQLGNLSGLDIQLSWDATIIKYVNHTTMIPVEEYPNGVLHEPVLKIRENVSENFIKIVYISMPPAEPFNNPGKSNIIFTVTFKAIRFGVCDLNFTSVELCGVRGSEIFPIHHEVRNGYCKVKGPEGFNLKINSLDYPEKIIANQKFQLKVEVCYSLDNVTDVMIHVYEYAGPLLNQTKDSLYGNGTEVYELVIVAPSTEKLRWQLSVHLFYWDGEEWIQSDKKSIYVEVSKEEKEEEIYDIYVDASNVNDPYENGSPEHPFNEIREALDAAKDGDKIFVRSGTYYEIITVVKSVSLIGEDLRTTIIDGCERGTVVYITADNVILTNFTIRNSAESSFYDYAGIKLYSSSGSRIIRNKIEDCGYGIYLEKSSNNSIECNTIIAYDGDIGIYLTSNSSRNLIENNSIVAGGRIFIPNAGVVLYSSNNTVRRNLIDGFRDGICNSYQNYIHGNVLKRNLINGIYNLDASDSIIAWNLIEESEIGIQLNCCFNCTITHNIIKKCKQSGWTFYSYTRGIYLHSARNSTISRNIIKESTYGLYFDQSSNNTIYENSIGYSEINVYLFWSSNNKFYHNNFMSEYGQVLIKDSTEHPSVNKWDDGFPSGGNYWVIYKILYPNAKEIDDLGIWDTPNVFDEKNIDRYPLTEPFIPISPEQDFVESRYVRKDYKIANYYKVESWIWENCIPLLLLNKESALTLTPEGLMKFYDADTNLQHEDHRPDWYWRIVVDYNHKRFCVQLIGYWEYQYGGIEQCCLPFFGHPYDYEPIFLYYSYYGDDFYSSLENNEVIYEYVFCPVGHGNVKFGSSTGTDCDVDENCKLYFWEDEEGNRHPVFSLGVAFESKGTGMVSSGIITSLAGHAYGYVRRRVEILTYIMTGEEFIEKAKDYGYEGFWPENKEFNDDFKNHVHWLTDSIISEWSQRKENPFKMLPIYSDESGPSMDLVDPWNSLYEGKYPSVGEVFNPNSLFYLDINYTISVSPEEGEWSEEFHYTSVEANKVNFYLNWEGDCNLDLHIWLAEERDGKLIKIPSTHVGENYQTGEMENGLDEYKVGSTIIHTDYSGDTEPEIITITACHELLGKKEKTKVPSLSFIIQVYTRKSGEDPSFLLVSRSFNETTLEKLIPTMQGKNYEFDVFWEGRRYKVSILTDSNITDFKFNQFEKEISFNACEGFFNITIPKKLLDGTFTVIVNNDVIDFIESSNETHSFLHFVYTEPCSVSIKGTTVIPEFRFITLLLMMTMATIVAIVSRKLKKLP